MPNFSTNEFKPGLKVMLDGEPCSILENEFVKPGKGQAFNRVKLRNLKSGRVWERTFKSGDTLEGADVMDIDYKVLWPEGSFDMVWASRPCQLYSIAPAHIFSEEAREARAEEGNAVTRRTPIA